MGEKGCRGDGLDFGKLVYQLACLFRLDFYDYVHILGSDEKDFADRLSKLRMQKGVSARDMSLSIGQNPGYINNIETGKALPSMTNIFYICSYLNVTPMDFFDFDAARPRDMDMICNALNKLTDSQFDNIKEIIGELARLNGR